VEETVRRTPGTSLREVFLVAAARLRGEDDRAEVVADALDYLQRGFENHYAVRDGATDEEVLVGDNAE
jgi:hypothetical protein